MAQENTGPHAEAVQAVVPAKTPEPKKQRAPRRSKAVGEPAPAVSEAAVLPPANPAKPGRRGRGRKPKSIETKVPDGRSTLNSAGRTKTAKPVEQLARASAPVLDEIEDLIQLEEENKRLRKLLADKLRQENTELRKRLGLD
ncbi:SyrB2 regulator [Rhizobium sp. 1AS11]|nr:SyrB2 regulator [Rhizobium acaciae]MCW1413732.1 SyrB2 regulator [Rhizobium acaciae]MCW1746126.1 SyrB2 regulator [Rhizobium acaciae]